MKKCPYCSSLNKDQSTYCESCGKKLSEYVQICPKCKNPINIDSTYCSSCGENLIVQEEVPTPQKISQKQKPVPKRLSRLNIFFIVIFSIIGAALISFGALMIFGSYLNTRDISKVSDKTSAEAIELKQAELSDDQERLLASFGYPDEFTIAFVEENDNLRVETWLFEDMESCFTFVSGEFGSQDHVVTLKLAEDNYDVGPEDFIFGMKPDEVNYLLGEDGIETAGENEHRELSYGDGLIVCTFNEENELVMVNRTRIIE